MADTVENPSNGAANTIAGPERQDFLSTSPSLINLVNALLSDESISNKIAATTADSAHSPQPTLTYAQLNEASNQMAEFLIRSGIRIVGLLMRPCINWIISLVGVIRAKAIYVPLEPTLPLSRIQYIIQDSGLQIILKSVNQDSNLIQAIGGPIMELDVEQILQSNLPPVAVPPPHEVDIDSLVCMMYTSGSTGLPKGVKVSQSALLNRLQWQWDAFPYDLAVDVGCCKTSLAYGDAICEILAPLLKIIPVVIVESPTTLSNPAKFIAILNEHRISRLIVVPSLLIMMIEYLSAMNAEPLTHLRSIVCSGEELKAALLERFFDCVQLRGVILMNFYGTIEVMGDATIEIFQTKEDLKSKINADGRVSIGKPLYNVKVQLANVDENGIGEIIVLGAGVNQGYHHPSLKEMDRFILLESGRAGGFRTGDLAKIIDGRLYYYGRNDTLVKIRGNRLDLTEIEMALQTEKDIANPIVLYDSERQVIVAFAVADLAAAGSGTTVNLDPKSILARLSTKLPSYAVPSQMMILDEMPLLPASGKIDRQRLLSLAQQQHTSSQQETGMSRQEIYSKLNPDEMIKMIALENALESIGIRFPPAIIPSPQADDPLSLGFFQIGGNSMNAVMLVTSLRRKGYMVNMDQFLSGRNTIKDILQLMEPVEDSNPATGGLTSGLHGLNLTELEAKFEAVPLEQIDRKAAIDLIVRTFSKHACPVVAWHCNKARLIAQHNAEFALSLERKWDHYIREGLSFGIRRKSDGALVGVSLGIDAIQHPLYDYSKSSTLAPVFRYIKAQEAPVMKQLIQNEKLEKIASHFVVAVDDDEQRVDPGEKTSAVIFAELKEIELATKLGYEAIIACNVNPLTIHLGQFYLGYQVVSESNMQEYTDPVTGERPFAKAAVDEDTQKGKVQMCIKRLKDH